MKIKRILTIMTGLFLIPTVSQAYEPKFKYQFYGELNADMYYKYAPVNDATRDSTMYVWQNYHNSIKSINFLERSNLGVTITHDTLQLKAELGVSDIFRKFALSYSWKNGFRNKIQIGREDNLANYNFNYFGNGELGLSDYGMIPSNRRLQARYSINDFSAAIIMPFLHNEYEEANDNGYQHFDENGEFLGFPYIPRIELAYEFDKPEEHYFKVFGSYGVYSYNPVNKDRYKTMQFLHTANVGFGGRIDFGVSSFLNMTAWAALNGYLNNALNEKKYSPIIVTYNVHPYTGKKTIDIRYSDIYSFGGAVSYGMVYTDVFDNDYIPQIGIGYSGHFSEDFVKMDNRIAAFANITFKIKKYFEVIPEAAFFYDITDGRDITSNTFFFTVGINTRFIF